MLLADFLEPSTIVYYQRILTREQVYKDIINRIYQATLLRQYFINIGKTFVKSPKVFFNDTVVLCSLLRINSKEQLLNSPYSGQIFETYVFCELQKHLSYLQKSSQMFHYRTNDKK